MTASDPGRPILQYVILDVLGSGAFSKVLRAQHRKTQCTAALKVIPKSRIQTASDRENLSREVSLMRSLDHPFIATFYEFFEDASDYVISMEVVETGTLLQTINVWKSVPEPKAQRIFYQLTMVLDYLHHAKHIIHRDIKAENILVDENINIRVIDFGFANTFTESDSYMATTCGSPFYIAPEVVRDEEYTTSADIWSAGVVLYAMLVGALPWANENMAALINAILTTEPVLPSHLSAEARSLIGGILRKEPEKRLTIPEILAHPWLAEFRDCSILGDDGAVIPSLRVHSPPQLDHETVTQLTDLGYDTTNLREQIQARADSQPVAAYRMLRQMDVQEALRSWHAVRRDRRGSGDPSPPRAISPPLSGLPAITSQDALDCTTMALKREPAKCQYGIRQASGMSAALKARVRPGAFSVRTHDPRRTPPKSLLVPN
jgi:serine/threonine protein kinase